MASQVDVICAMDELARKYGKKIFRLREISAWLNISRPAAGMLLLRMEKKNLVSRVATVWINLRNPPTLQELSLSLRSPSYISFESALFAHHILSQSPRGEFTLVSAGRPGRFITPLGVIRFIHLRQDLFFGFDRNRMAYPEKAWLDLLYIRGLKNRNVLVSEEFQLNLLNKKKLTQFAKYFPNWVQERL